MPYIAHPCTAFKAMLKTGSGCHVWTAKDFCLFFIHKQWGFPKQGLACVKAFKFLKQKSGSASAAT